MAEQNQGQKQGQKQGQNQGQNQGQEQGQDRNLVTEATVGFAEETRDYVNRLSGAWTEATQRWVGALQQFTPNVNAEGYGVPSQKEVIDASFDIAEQVLGFQRQLASQIADRFGSLVTTDGQPLGDKIAQQLNEQAQQASSQVQQATQQAQGGQQGGQGGSGGQGAQGGASVDVSTRGGVRS